MKKLYWIFGPEEYKNSGIFKYSLTFIRKLKEKENLDIREKYVSFKSNSIVRYIYQLFILPLMIITVYRKSSKVFVDESFTLATLFPLFPYKTSLFIVHDYRDPYFTKQNPGTLEKIYFRIRKKADLNLRKFDKIITVSEFSKNSIIESLGVNAENIEVIENSFEMNEKCPTCKNKEDLLKKYNIGDISSKILLDVSSEESRKNIDVIINAMESLEGYIFVKIGKPIIKENRSYNKYLIKMYNLEEKIFFLEDVPEKDLDNFYRISDIFVFPSSFEGFGRPPIEAQMRNVPVISSGIQVLKDNLGEGAIFLEDERNPNEIVDAIKKLDNGKELREKLIENGKENSKRFDIEKNYKKFHTVLKNYFY